MTKLAEIVMVERRFALSARVDTDLNGTPPLTGYVLQASVRKSLARDYRSSGMNVPAQPNFDIA